MENHMKDYEWQAVIGITTMLVLIVFLVRLLMHVNSKEDDNESGR